MVGCRDLFGAIVNLLSLELLMYAELLKFTIGSNNMYEGIFYQM